MLRPLLLVGVILTAVASAGCTGPAAQAGGPASDSPPPASQTPNLDPVPAQLWGTWEPTEPVSGSGDLLLNLVFSPHSFAFYDHDMTNAAIGRAWAGGSDQITFGTRGPCSSLGTYTWKITAGQLTLSGGTNDFCMRRQALVTRVWKKTSDSTKPADTDVTS
jgi:hypothetical protein